MAYTLKYTIPFVDVDDLSYVIEISEDNGSGSEVTELIPGKDPIVVNYKDDDNIYNPLRFAGATITVLVEKPLFDLYATGAQQYKVVLKQEDQIKYTGFITPEVFSQDYNGYLTEFQIESISALSTLEYFRVETQVDGNKLDFIKGSHTAGLLNEAFGKTQGAYTDIYFPMIFNLAESTYTLTQYWMLSQNFVDDDGEAWTYKDFLEEFCTFFGWTLTEKDGKVYFLDIDYMKNNNRWFRYDGSMSSGAPVTLPNDLQYLSEEESTGSGNDVSIVPAYSKVTVKDSDYEFTVEFPQLKNLKAYSGHSPKTYLATLFAYSNGDYKKRRNQTWDIYRYYTTNDTIKLYLYDQNGNEKTDGYPTDFSELDRYMGARIERHQRYDSSDKGKVEFEYGPVYVFKNFTTAENGSGLYSVNGKNTGTGTLLRTGGNSESVTGLPYLLVKTDPVVLGNTYIQVKFQAAITKEQYGAFQDLTLWQKDKWKHIASRNTFYTYARLRFGEYYWNGSSGRWSKASATFRIDFSVSDGDHSSTGYFKDIKPGQTGVTAGGFEGRYVVPVTKSAGMEDIHFGEIELVLYYPRYPWGNSDHTGATFAFIKDLKLAVAAEDEEDKYVEARQDTLYSGENDAYSYINEYDDIELKITTQKQTDPVKSYSRVFTGGEPLEHVTHIGIPASGEISETDRPEYYLIAKYLHQYSEPRKKLTQDTTTDYDPFRFIEDSTFPGMKFFITGEEINYQQNIASLTMEQIL
ncbi:MAG: hypothetical protein LIP04_16545 [Tannerellaceae bacterium]|nr:hypothetical protein [Tannerellaceae bacterium]